MTAQEILFNAWQKGYVLQPRNGKLRISHARRASIPPELISEVQAHKPTLLALLIELESYGAANDGLILGALAIFNAEPKGLVESPGIPRLPASPAREYHSAAGDILEGIKTAKDGQAQSIHRYSMLRHHAV
jgi:hypothetical protein